MQTGKHFQTRRHLRPMRGSHADRRLLRCRPGARPVYEQRADPAHGDLRQWKRFLLCLTTDELARLVAYLGLAETPSGHGSE